MVHLFACQNIQNLLSDRCSELVRYYWFQLTKVSYFGKSVTKMYTTQEDYKPVIIIPLGQLSDSQKLISLIPLGGSLEVTPPSFEAPLQPTIYIASFISRLANTDYIDRPIYGLSAQQGTAKPVFLPAPTKDCNLYKTVHVL